MDIQFIKLSKFGVMPTKAHEHDMGFDLYSSEDSVIIPGGQNRVCSTDIAIDIPVGWGAKIESRSGNASKKNFFCIGGIIDAGYRNSIGVIVYNYDKTDRQIRRGEKIGQLLFHQVPKINFIEVEKFEEETARGLNGFGSTGN